MTVDLKALPLDKVKGSNRQLIREMSHLGIYSVFDLLTFFPSAHQFKQINRVVNKNKKVKFKLGKSVSVQIHRDGPVKQKTCTNGAYFTYFHGIVVGSDKEIWFHSFGFENLMPKLSNHSYFDITGRLEKYLDNFNITISTTKGREYGSIKAYKPLVIHAIGKYTSKNGVPQEHIRNMVFTAFTQYHSYIKDNVPRSVRIKKHILSREKAIFQCHYPSNDNMHKLGMLSEKFNELYAYAMELQRLHAKRSRSKGFSISPNINALKQFRDSLPYELTNDQKDSVEDILYDMKKPYRMARLLQGDVGSGKTVVSAFGILSAIEAGYQTAIMIPSIVLGGQHYQTFSSLFKPFGVRIALLTGNTKGKEKRRILDKLQKGEIDLIIGTEALYQKRTHYKKLGLVVIDEQHRFGVRQRRLLEQKTKGCNILSMTATPIPRTLATAMYHAMDISQIRHLPKGRKPIITKYLPNKLCGLPVMASLIKDSVKKGGQAFVVAKLVRPTKKSKKLSDAVTTHAKLQQLLARDGIKVGLVYGNKAGKNQVVQDFIDGKYQVLVATSVIEVGVDVPHANNMIILDADRYGLAQLHQLRGRVGRNSLQAYCFLVGNPRSKVAKKRLKVMEQTDDGFKLAEEDLKIRHSGNIFGRNQSGLPDFPLADLSQEEDNSLLLIANQEAGRSLRDAKDE